MKVREISVTVQKTVQAVQFEPVVVAVTMTAELEAGDKASKVRAKLYEAASEGVHEHMQEELKLWKRKAKSKD
jgi:hypothetical protein